MTTRCEVSLAHDAYGVDTAEKFGITASEKIAVADIMAVREMAPHLVGDFKGSATGVRAGTERLRSSLTFCIIPMAAAIRARCDGAVWPSSRAGRARHAEIGADGVDLTSYGADLPGTSKLAS